MVFKLDSPPPQIGNRFALTAAHCLYSDDNEEVLPATSFSIVLGLHDRRKTKEPNRWLFRFTKGLRFTLVCKPNFGNARILGAYGRPTKSLGLDVRNSQTFCWNLADTFLRT